VIGYGIYSDEDPAVYVGIGALGFAAILDLAASIRIHAAGMELGQAARAMQFSAS